MDASTLIERTFRRVQMLFGRARITFVDDSGPVQIMQVKMSDFETPDNRYRLAEFGLSSNPPVGSDALALHVAGDRTGGAIFATNHQPSRPKGLAPGETMLYSQDGKYVYLTASGGIVVEAKGQSVVVNDASAVTVNASTTVTLNAPQQIIANTPLLKCSGDIIDNYGSNARTMAQMRAIYNGHIHPVPNVQGGSSTINSNPPNQSE